MHTKRTFKQTLTIVGICLLINVAHVSSAVSNGEKNRVSLGDVIQTALRENPELKAVREKVNVARARFEGIALLKNPELETELMGGAGAVQAFELTQTIQLGGQRGHQKRIAKTRLEKANAELAEASRLLTTSVKTAFYTLALAQEKYRMALEIVQYNRQMHEIAAFQFEAGDISLTQANLANIQHQSALRETATLGSELRLAQLELNGAMGISLEANVPIEGLSEEISTGVPDGVTLETLKAHARAHRTDLKSLRLDAALTKNKQRLAQASNIPDLNVGALAQHSTDTNRFGVKLTIPLPLFDRNRADINAAKAQQGVDTAHISDAERRITREVIAAFLSLNTARETLRFYKDNVLKLLTENLHLTRAAYELGEAGLLEVILMQNEFVKTQFAYLDALAAYYSALTQLEAAIGTSVERLQQPRNTRR